MDLRKGLIAVLAGFALLQVTSFLIHGLILSETYRKLADVLRADAHMSGKMWLAWVANLLYAVFFVYIWVRGVERKTWAGQGFRFGIVMTCMAWIPLVLVIYVYFPIPYGLALAWIAAGAVQFILLGLLTAALYRPTLSETSA